MGIFTTEKIWEQEVILVAILHMKDISTIVCNPLPAYVGRMHQCFIPSTCYDVYT